jgi:metal-dependent amidase/aminoacylase/carboxypeptidase family protein
MLKAGTAFNIIPDTVEMTGTLRCFDAELRATLLESLKRTPGSHPRYAPPRLRTSS